MQSNAVFMKSVIIDIYKRLKLETSELNCWYDFVYVFIPSPIFCLIFVPSSCEKKI